MQQDLDRIAHSPNEGGIREVSVCGDRFAIVDRDSFLSMYRAHFVRQDCRFNSLTRRPVIIDCGANIGITVRYWKWLFPESQVIAFEPDELCFEALSRNCEALDGVECHRAAVWVSDEDLQFAAVGRDGGHISSLAERADDIRVVTVPAVRLRRFLQGPVDLLKIDIEGSEVDVLTDCSDRLTNVSAMFVELHSFVGRPQRVAELFNVIEQAGFRVHAKEEAAAPQPFVNRPVYNEKDFRMNVYCVRE